MTPQKEYKHINLEYINELADGEDDFLKEIVDTFLSTIPVNLEKLTLAINNNDRDGVLFYAHKLKGTFNFIGSTQLTHTFTLIEEHCKEAVGFELLPDLMKQILEFSDSIIAELEDLVSGIE